MTERQIMLFYREALRADRRACANRLADINAGMAGGAPAKERLAALLKED